jgi:hypothetical protein
VSAQSRAELSHSNFAALLQAELAGNSVTDYEMVAQRGLD